MIIDHIEISRGDFKMSVIELNISSESFSTDRKDSWKQSWLLFGFTFVAFAVYSILVVAFDFKHGVRGVVTGADYQSPFYGPDLTGYLSNWPVSLPFALLTLWAPFGFRGTCYYMRRVYYRSIFSSPPGCAIEGFEGRRGKYSGETKFPFFLNNYHKYFLYLAIVLGLFHWYEVILGVFHDGIYIGVGTIFAFLDAFFLTLYISSCHAFRNIFGGSSKRPGKFKYNFWSFISGLNERHGIFFWLSLFSIWIYDIYIRLVAWGFLTEVRFV